VDLEGWITRDAEAALPVRPVNPQAEEVGELVNLRTSVRVVRLAKGIVTDEHDPFLATDKSEVRDFCARFGFANSEARPVRAGEARVVSRHDNDVRPEIGVVDGDPIVEENVLFTDGTDAVVPHIADTT